MRVLFIAILCTACATSRFPQPEKEIVYFNTPADAIKDRLLAAMSEPPPHVHLHVWSVRGKDPTLEDAIGFAADADHGIIYVNERALELDDDIIAFGIAHELYHVQHASLTKRGIAFGWLGASAGTGVAVAYHSTWWLGTIVSGGLFSSRFRQLPWPAYVHTRTTPTGMRLIS